ncbi:glycoside hydrolase family 127 protein [Cellulomonas sp. NS3]|uniref:glycoside hydrolase family 127 protein n=1 Tax=Cellulomonas sp. NS3 TaxID=2973977 RepID=UPI002162C019|nr:beta-L-arabinofuranosidase domain-containing protein [Cellulomonas sp. NS3]
MTATQPSAPGHAKPGAPLAEPGPGTGPTATGASPHVRLQPLPFAATRLSEDGELGRWQALNRTATLPHLVENLESSGALDNLRRVAGHHDGLFRGFNFADSDVHKSLEAIAWEAGRRPEAQDWEGFTRDVVELLAAAQDDDGYLDSHYQELPQDGGDPAAPAGVDRRWTDLRWGHELYVLGHLVQAAVARTRTTGRTDLLDVARRFADHAVRRFGAGGVEAYCGHPEVETALVELYRLTGERAYLDLAQRMVDLRGSGLLGSGPFEPAYHQDHAPVRGVTEATGHAVRQLYLAAGVADLVAETGDRELLDALVRLWDSAQGTKAYVTGGLGARHKDESFGDAYELPPDRAYAETCAAIASLQWAWRMLLLTGEGRYADEMERTLHNAVAASTSLDGTHFFYSNPLQVRTGHDGSSEYSASTRLPWFACACCPPNLARLVASLHAYVATRDERGVQLHLYADGTITPAGDGDGDVRLRVSTAYPWDGRVTVDVLDGGDPGAGAGETRAGAAAEGDPRGGFVGELALRVPGWVLPGGAVLRVDGVELTVDVAAVHASGGYVRVAPGARRIELDLAMPPVAVRAHPRVDAVRGCVALRRGPVVFCLEQADLPAGVALEDVRLAAGTRLDVGPPDPAIGAPVTIEADGVHVPAAAGMLAVVGAGEVPVGAGGPVGPDLRDPDAPLAPLRLRAVPYQRWANRDEGAMRVWVPVQGWAP